MSARRFVGALAATILATGLAVAGVTTPASAASSVPRFDHVVLVMFENHATTQITSSTAPRTTAC